MSNVKVKARVTTAGLTAGEEVEVERSPLVDELLRLGMLVELRLKRGTNLPV